MSDEYEMRDGARETLCWNWSTIFEKTLIGPPGLSSSSLITVHMPFDSTHVAIFKTKTTLSGIELETTAWKRQ